MKISNKYLEREFHYDSNKFYTLYFHNLMNNDILRNTSCLEFVITFKDETILTSNDFIASIDTISDDCIEVLFVHQLCNLKVRYESRYDVIAKRITMYKCDKEVDYIDLENLKIPSPQYWSIKEQNDVSELAGYPGRYIEFGQPVYIGSLFLGMEFPMAENCLRENEYHARYYLGGSISQPKQFWDCIVGSALSTDYKDVQKYFFDYIKGSAQENYFRKQYNSWYDFMTNIDEDNILESFAAIHKGFSDYGIQLDSYVVDDGWPDYQSFWEFNHKFPNGLKKVLKQVSGYNADLGLWIGPRGGYNGTEVILADWLQENGLGSKNKLSNDVNLTDFNYLNRLKEKMLRYQREYNIGYWKIDGWLLRPDSDDGSGEYSFYTMTRVYEFLIQLLSELRQDKGDKKYWINLTSYVNPSPWFLKWVNSLWIQISQDHGFLGTSGGDLDKMMTYRDGQYFNFLNKREIQLPLWSLYNHDPIYAKSLYKSNSQETIHSTVDEFEKYLLFISTRGNGFWEFYYSPEMFNSNRWEVNARCIKWIEKNYHILQHSELIGGNPNTADIYGYRCLYSQGGEEIVSLRNPSGQIKKIELSNFDLSLYKVEYNSIKGEKVIVNGNLQPNQIVILRRNKISLN